MIIVQEHLQTVGLNLEYNSKLCVIVEHYQIARRVDLFLGLAFFFDCRRLALSQELRQRMFTVGVELFLAPQVRNQHFMFVVSVFHQHNSMIRLHYVDDSAWLASVHSLQEANTFTNLEKLMQQSSLHFDCDWYFFLSF
jgi:hypothetical protein